MNGGFTLRHLLLAAILTPLTACSSEPPHKAIEQKFFKCDKSRNLQGGNYGLGPFKRLGPGKAACSSSEWVEVDKAEFKRLATTWYGVDWSKESDFWR